MRRTPWTPDDAELALRVADGQQWAFEELADRHRALLKGASGEFFAPGETEDDLLQCARIGLYKAACTFDPTRGMSFRNFANLAVHAELITAVKAARRGKHGPLNESERFEAPRAGADGEVWTLVEMLPAPMTRNPEAQVIARDELERLIRLAWTRLSLLEQTVLARKLNGASLAECGRGLGSSAQGAAKTADNALQRIRHKLAA